MNHELLAILEYIEQERGVSKDQLVEAVEKALLSALKNSKLFQTPMNLEVKMDRTTGDIRVWATLEVVENCKVPTRDQIILAKALQVKADAVVGETIRAEVTPSNFGRIAAQTAKQTILQSIRDAEKATVKDEFQEKVGQLVSGTVRRYEQGSVIVDLQKAEGVIGPKDRVPGEQYMPGDRINALLVKIDTAKSGPNLILSRASADFIVKLFEREVSEIHDGVVEIAGIAREPGSRTKIAVKSADPRIDPVGACVGMRGMRVKNITNELNGERMDIIAYVDDPAKFAANALHPAKAEKIELNEAEKTLTFFVNSENSRLAFGKKAQNVRLAQKLMHWKIDIKITDAEELEEKEESFEAKKAEITRALSAQLGISEDAAGLLVANGFLTLDGLKAAAEGELENIKGLTEEDLASIQNTIAQSQASAQE